ncbi:MAG: squalene synthase HpnC [Betaproteobacteria bacterium]|nr:squalene synthase HpnC [Betaproteobacteria bacterium]
MSVGHYENFPVASLLLPRRLREPIEIIYRFARTADDFADEGDEPNDLRLSRLSVYRAGLERIARGEPPQAALFDDIARIVRAHGLPLGLFRDLLDAFAQDVTKKRYANFAELRDYCRRSANPVGRLLLHLFKRTSEHELAGSDSICTALQLINFWQGVERDFAKGRIYLPQDEMASHGVSERHIAEARCDAAWRSLLAFQVARSRAMILAGAPLARSLPGRIGLEIRTTLQGGLRILEKIERVDYDVFRRRPVLRALDWPLLLARAV